MTTPRAIHFAAAASAPEPLPAAASPPPAATAASDRRAAAGDQVRAEYLRGAADAAAWIVGLMANPPRP